MGESRSRPAVKRKCRACREPVGVLGYCKGCKELRMLVTRLLKPDSVELPTIDEERESRERILRARGCRGA